MYKEDFPTSELCYTQSMETAHESELLVREKHTEI